jgi:hypothetical protein
MRRILSSLFLLAVTNAVAQNADPMQPLILPTAQFDEAAAVRQQVKNGESPREIFDAVKKQQRGSGQPDPGPAYDKKLMELIRKEQRLDLIDDQIAMQKTRLGEGWFASSNSQVRRPIQEQIKKLEREREQIRKEVQQLTREMSDLEEQARAASLR